MRFPLPVLLRAFAVQGSWNYETLLGTGFGFVILPALRRLHADPAVLQDASRGGEVLLYGTLTSSPLVHCRYYTASQPGLQHGRPS